MRKLHALLPCAVIAIAVGCAEEPPPAAEVVRPVKLLTLDLGTAGVLLEYPGKVDPAQHADVAFEVLAPFVAGSIDDETLRAILDDAYARFAHPAVTPLAQLDAGRFAELERRSQHRDGNPSLGVADRRLDGFDWRRLGAFGR